MDPEACPIGDRLQQGTSDAREVAGRYDQWARGHDDDVTTRSYQAPAVVAATVVTRCPDAGSVLDVGCGNRPAGHALRERGFAGQILGLDVSQASLEIAQQRGAHDSTEANP